MWQRKSSNSAMVRKLAPRKRPNVPPASAEKNKKIY
jgi:hypothetical protein